MTSSYDPLISDLSGLPINDFIVELKNKANKQESHEAFKGGLTEYLSPATKLRQMADELEIARDAAAGHDINKVAELNRLRLIAQQALTFNARHIAALALYRNDPGLLLNGGYDPNVKHYNKSNINLLDLVPEAFLKHTGISGYLIAVIKRAKNGATVEVQTTTKNPADESSWDSIGIYTKARIDLKGNEPASTIYIRSRYHEGGNTGRWSTPVGIIVL